MSDGLDAERTRARATYVYKCRDTNGEWLYIGLSGTSTRLSTHAATASWWPDVATIEVEHFASRKEAGTREIELIREHQPPWNVQHVGPRRILRAESDSDLLSVSTVAQMLGVSPRWVKDNASTLGGFMGVVNGRDAFVFEEAELHARIEIDGRRETAERKRRFEERNAA